MNASAMNILIPAAAGVIGILIGSFKPLIDWNIEKRRRLQEERKQLLKDFRHFLTNENLTQMAIVTSIPYSRIRPNLSKELTKRLENRYEPVYPGNLRDWLTINLLDELHQIEKRWGLL